MLKESQSDIEKIDAEIVDGSIKIHQMFGLGFLESAYQRCLERELQKRGKMSSGKFYYQFSMNAN